MPEKPFRVNLFSVTNENSTAPQPTSFRSAVDACIAHKQLFSREKDIKGKIRRLDAEHVDRELYFLNFLSFEYAGPGRVRRGQPVTPIAMTPEDWFEPETAMLYDAENELAFVESVQVGVGQSVIAAYFGEFADSGTHYNFVPILDTEAHIKANRYQTIRSMTVRVPIGPGTNVDAADLGPIAALGNRVDGGFIELTIGVGLTGRSSLERQGIRDWMARWLGRRVDGSNQDSVDGSRQVTKFTVTGKEHEDDDLTELNLIQQRERRQVSLPIHDSSRKIPYDQRWDALKRFHFAYTHSQ